jgi:type VI secretion system protein VasD
VKRARQSQAPQGKVIIVSMPKVLHGLRSAILCAALVPALGAACSSPQRPNPGATCDLPQNIQMVLRGSERLNPNDEGRSLPVVVRVYQLKGITRFEEAEFETIWRNDRETLGPDLVKVEEFYVYPTQRLARSFRREDGATHVVVMAIFRHPAGQAWREMYELPPPPGEERCAQQQGDPNAPAPAVRDPRYYFFLEDYYIEAGGNDVTEDAGVRRRVPSTLPGNLGAPSRPSNSPQLPNQLPNAPQVPNAPQAPQVPNAPSAPSAPSMPSAPSAPSVPSVPGLGALPGASIGRLA